MEGKPDRLERLKPQRPGKGGDGDRIETLRHSPDQSLPILYALEEEGVWGGKIVACREPHLAETKLAYPTADPGRFAIASSVRLSGYCAPAVRSSDVRTAAAAIAASPHPCAVSAPPAAHPCHRRPRCRLSFAIF